MDNIELLVFDEPDKQLKKPDSGLSALVDEQFGSLEAFTQEVADLTNKGFGIGTTVEDVKNHVFSVDRLYLGFDEGKLVTFASFDHHRFAGKNILYLSGIIVDPECQKKGIFTTINSRELGAFEPDYLVMRTQNPVVYGATRRHLVESLCPGCSRPPDDALLIASAIALTYGFPVPELEDYLGHLVMRGAYGTSFYDEIPYDPDGSPLFDSLKLDYQAGDAVVLVGKVQSDEQN